MTFLSDHAANLSFLRATIAEFNLPGGVTRWAAFDLPLTARGHVWTPRAIKLGSVSANSDQPGAGATIELGNADGSASTAFSGATKGSRVSVWDAWLDPALHTAVSQQETLICSGLLATWEAKQDVLTVTIDPFVPWLGIPIPRRSYSLACSLQFKGALCAYAGADAACDRSRAACIAKSNFANFGGFGRIDG